LKIVKTVYFIGGTLCSFTSRVLRIFIVDLYVLTRGQKFSKHIGATSKLYAPGGWIEATDKAKTTEYEAISLQIMFPRPLAFGFMGSL